jgi:nucleoside-diphosphate-sugar epimerase
LNILLTGASGFTGRHFEQQALAAGHRVLPLDTDLTDGPALGAALSATEPFDALVHLAAISFVGHADNAAFYAVNTVGTSTLLQAVAALPPSLRPRKVLVASSANVYGNCSHSPIAENQAPAPLNHYAASKLAMEHMALTHLDALPIVITRPFNYTGPGQALSFLIPKLVDHFARRAPRIELGNLHVEREFNDVRWVCAAYLKLLEHGVPGETYNVCSGQSHSLQSVLDRLTVLSKHALEVQVNPAFVRANEVVRLAGDPGKLARCIGGVSHPDDLARTLADMLQAAGKASG